MKKLDMKKPDMKKLKLEKLEMKKLEMKKLEMKKLKVNELEIKGLQCSLPAFRAVFCLQGILPYIQRSCLQGSSPFPQGNQTSPLKPLLSDCREAHLPARQPS